LCRLDDIAEGGSIGLSASIGGRARALMAVRQGDDVYVYVNACPHRGLPLDFKPGRFLTHDGEYILCSNHAALFRIEDGHCVAGPCKGAGLAPVQVKVREGEVFLVD
jgi:nitrite reductase/ring-hydroxylating ferredoxin subunit